MFILELVTSIIAITLETEFIKKSKKIDTIKSISTSDCAYLISFYFINTAAKSSYSVIFQPLLIKGYTTPA